MGRVSIGWLSSLKEPASPIVYMSQAVCLVKTRVVQAQPAGKAGLEIDRLGNSTGEEICASGLDVKTSCHYT
jgi:hypothetical protein